MFQFKPRQNNVDIGKSKYKTLEVVGLDSTDQRLRVINWKLSQVTIYLDKGIQDRLTIHRSIG